MRKAEALAEARPRVIAALAAQFRDLDLAEEAFSEATAKYLEQRDPIDNPAGWLMVVAKRKALDMRRREAASEKASDELSLVSDMADILTLPDPIPDERLRLLFICSHPAIALETRTALALRVICGLPVAEIARVFVSSEPTMYQRITRAKAKIREAKIDFELPPRKLWAERLDAVLLTLELAYTVAYQDAAQERDNELAKEVARLTAMLAELLPGEPEALGLAALVALARSREAARVDQTGVMVPLSQQDTGLWNRREIECARVWLDQAAQLGRSGPYQLMAAIQLTHARRAFDGRVDWPAILTLYDALLVVRPNPIVALNRALALSEVEGVQRGLEAICELPAESLLSLRPYHVAKAKLLAAVGRTAEAQSSYQHALALSPPSAERLWLEQQLRDLVAGQSTLKSVE